MVFFAFVVIAGLALFVAAFRKKDSVIVGTGVILIMIGIGGFYSSDLIHEYDVLKETPVAAATADPVAELPTSALTELYACFDGELRQLPGTTITRDARDKCLSRLDEMMLEYERVIQQHKSETWWSEEVCAEAAAQFWPRITKLVEFGIPNFRPEVTMIRLYQRYGALMNQSYAIAYRVSARSE